MAVNSRHRHACSKSLSERVLAAGEVAAGVLVVNSCVHACLRDKPAIESLRDHMCTEQQQAHCKHKVCTGMNQCHVESTLQHKGTWQQHRL